MAYPKTRYLVEMPVDDFIPPLTRYLDETGFRAVKSFDLRSACAPLDAACPHHGRHPCNCQLVVLLVYDGCGSPHSLTIHGTDGHCEIVLLDEGSRSSREAEASIRLIIEMTIDECAKRNEGYNSTAAMPASMHN